MNKKVLLIILILTVVLAACAFIYNNSSTNNSLNSHSNDTSDSVLTIRDDNILKHKYYSFAYSEEYEQALWVNYTLHKNQVGGEEPRLNIFTPDPMVSTQTADDTDYYKSGYDRGHLAPAADMSWSAEALKESFYYSNISPQNPSFNRGVWKKLEEKVRGWAIEFDSINIYAGPIFKNIQDTIGANGIVVPGYFFKVLLIYHNSEYAGIGFILPNSKSSKSILNFTVTIDSVESTTGLDFYKYLPEKVENSIESSFNLPLWGLHKSK